MPAISARAASFTESVIREMNRLAVDAGAVSLAQGFPDFESPWELRAAAIEALHDDISQYAITWGAKPLRAAIAAKTTRFHPDWVIDPETQVTVTCGATEAMVAAMLGVIDPGDEVVVFEPFYENYGPDAILSGATARYVTLHEPDWSIDPDELRAAFNGRTRAIVVNSPHNPTGKVFSRAELELIAGLCQEFDAVALTDDIYQHIVFEGEHIPMATLPGMADRTIAIDSMSKTYSVTGWRIGWTIASPELSVGIRRVHDFLTVGCGRPPPGRRRGRASLPRHLLRQARRGLPGAARSDRAGDRSGRLPGPPAGRRLLRDDRHRRPDRRGRRDVRSTAHRRPGDRRGPGLVVLLATRARSGQAQVRFPEAQRDARCRRRTARPDPALALRQPAAARPSPAARASPAAANR